MSMSYISGKITGLSRLDYTANFQRAAKLLEENGIEPVNPVEVVLAHCAGVEACGGEGDIHHWRCYMKHDIAEMMRCDSITLLPNWETSTGAKIEMDIADKLEYPMYVVSHDYKHLIEWRNHA